MDEAYDDPVYFVNNNLRENEKQELDFEKSSVMILIDKRKDWLIFMNWNLGNHWELIRKMLIP